jgi:hypothetical protein
MEGVAARAHGTMPGGVWQGARKEVRSRLDLVAAALDTTPGEEGSVAKLRAAWKAL